MLNIGVPRIDEIKLDDMVMPPSMGTAMPLYFQMIGRKCAITGDFELTAEEVNPVANVLVRNGITVTPVHHHMLTVAQGSSISIFGASANRVYSPKR